MAHARPTLFRVLALVLLALALFTTGCFLDRSGTLSDAGALDGGPLDASPDVDRDSGHDAGCSAMPHCEGDVVVSCAAGVRMEDRCVSRMAYCQDAACVPWACTPDSAWCEGSRVVERRCDARGSAFADTTCSRGCVNGVGCRVETACPLEVLTTIEAEGSVRLNTCGQGNDATHQPGCARVDIDGPDVIVRLEVPVSARHVIDWNALDGSDPILYVRRACDDATSEIFCNDDGPDGLSSQLDGWLDAGDYFLVLDTFADTDEGPEGRCGEMELIVSRP